MKNNLMVVNLIKNKSDAYSRLKKGSVEFGGKKFYAKSLWECNVAAYYEFLKSINEISDWFYEPDTFWFEKIKRGVRSYTPDFKIISKEGETYYVEVKGYMDSKSKTKLKRMTKYHPSVRIDLIDREKYKDICRLSGMIKNWDYLKNHE